jgi:hypothetical protein
VKSSVQEILLVIEAAYAEIFDAAAPGCEIVRGPEATLLCV